MLDRTVDFWVALCAAAIYVFLNSKEKAIHYRALMVGSSAGFGFSLAPEIALTLDIGVTLAGVIITVFGYIAIDILTAVVSDRDIVKSWIKGRLK